MIVLRSDYIKGALIAYLKTVSAITSKLIDYGSTAGEIREYQWNSRDFYYPAIRVRLVRNTPDDGDCKKAIVSMSLLVFTEDQSSAKADEISGIIATYFKGIQFSVSFLGSDYHFSLTRVTLIPAVSTGELMWRSEVVLEGYVSQY